MTDREGPERARWRRTESVLDRALELPPAERPGYLDAACAGDPRLRAEVEALLAAEECAPEDFLAPPSPDQVGDLLAGDLPGARDTGGAAGPATVDESGLVGRRLGPYEVVRAIGRGGMATVFEARDARLGRAVALKLLPAGWSAAAAAKARFLREARAVSALDHPNICTLHDIGESADGRLYLVLAYYPGETLRHRLSRGPLPVAEAVDLAAQVARGLARAHAAGIVHRDVKPSNVLVTAEGVAKILDFGVARIAGDAGLTRTGSALGTPAYMSPEQVRGEAVDARSDVFSLGAVLYEMLAGRQPFAGDSEQSTFFAVLEREPEPLDRLRPEVPAALAATVARALSKTPGDRHPSAAALAEELDPAGGSGSGAGAVAASGAAGARRRWPPSRRRFLGGLAALLAAATVLGVVAGVPAVRDPLGRWHAGAVPDGEARGGGASAAVPASPIERLDAARELLRHGYRRDNPERAIELLEGALRGDERDAPVHAALAEAFRWRWVRERDPLLLDRARANAELAVAENPDLAVAHIALGTALWLRGRSGEAIPQLEAAIRLDPRNAAARRQLGDALVAEKRPEEAAAAYTRATELDPGEWLAREGLGLLAYREGDYPAAEAHLREALTLAADAPSVHKNLAAVLHREGRHEEAASALQRALEIEPRDSTYTNLGTLQFFLGRYEEARESFQRALDLGANHYLRWANLGDADRWTGREAEAREDYLRAIQLVRGELAEAPDDPARRSRLALYLAKRGETAEALAELGRLGPIEAAEADVAYRAAVVRELAGRREAALAALATALAAGFPSEEIARDPELSELRRDPRYHRLIARAESRESDRPLPPNPPRPSPGR